MTHSYDNRSGVRYMTNGLKVYYVPWRPFVMQTAFPTVYGTLSIVRTILTRKRITVVHSHQAFSTLCHEALMHARTMGCRIVFTDHSLYGFADVESVHMNKVLQFALADIDQAVCVSHNSKENTVLRSGLAPAKVFVIPNAVDTAMFKPASVRLRTDVVTIVVISRLVYRKGSDLLVLVIPEVCRLYPSVLPDDMVVFAKPNPNDMVRAIENTISILPSIYPQEMHNRMKKLYSWQDFAKRTEIVYDRALKCSNKG